MSRFYIPADSIRQGKVIIKGKEAHHITDVLRLKENERIYFFDGSGKEYLSRIDKIGHQGLSATIEEVKNIVDSTEVKITLAQALPKKQKFDTVIEKATELGVEKIIPLITERTIVRLNAADYKQKKSRWEAIAISAAKQSGRTKIPVVAAPQAFLDFLPCLKNFDLGLIFCLEPQAQPLKEILRQKAKQKNVLALIGPEGDFSPQETEQALNYGAIAASLGRLVLKTDTASIAVLSILTYAYGS